MKIKKFGTTEQLVHGLAEPIAHEKDSGYGTYALKKKALHGI